MPDTLLGDLQLWRAAPTHPLRAAARRLISTTPTRLPQGHPQLPPSFLQLPPSFAQLPPSFLPALAAPRARHIIIRAAADWLFAVVAVHRPPARTQAIAIIADRGSGSCRCCRGSGRAAVAAAAARAARVLQIGVTASLWHVCCACLPCELPLLVLLLLLLLLLPALRALNRLRLLIMLFVLSNGLLCVRCMLHFLRMLHCLLIVVRSLSHADAAFVRGTLHMSMLRIPRRT